VRRLAALIFLWTLLGVARAEEACLESASPLGEEGARKGVQRKPFLKRLRAEITVWGGFFAADLTSTSYAYGGALAFWPSEDFGVEASLLVTPVTLAVERPLTQFFSGRVFNDSLAFAVVGDFLWSPIHYKIRVSERGIGHGDMYLALGAGSTFNQTIQGVTFNAGVGMKVYLGHWMAVRFDLRDYLWVQEAVAVQRVTNNIVGLMGFSVFLPGERPITVAPGSERPK
jgi:outer membrane beta-barrel protein